LVLVVNPAITYGAYQRLRDVLYPGKVNLRAHEAFRKFEHLSFDVSHASANRASQFSAPCLKP
jgi:hypothetical protein